MIQNQHLIFIPCVTILKKEYLMYSIQSPVAINGKEKQSWLEALDNTLDKEDVYWEMKVLNVRRAIRMSKIFKAPWMNEKIVYCINIWSSTYIIKELIVHCVTKVFLPEIRMNIKLKWKSPSFHWPLADLEITKMIKYRATIEYSQIDD